MSRNACRIPAQPGHRPGAPLPPIPDDAQVRALWDTFEMPDHIRRHSQVVADVADAMARAGLAAGLDPAEVDPPEVRASALLHDIAKAYTIRYGGNHSQIGAAWVVELTGNPRIAQGVLHHVHWPFELDLQRFFLPLVVAYADKRARHDELVTIPERFDDLLARYGHTPRAVELIHRTMDQALDLERRLSQTLGVDLHACTVDGGRLVQRA